METKEWLDIVVIPLTLGLIALLWPMIQNWHRCRTFTNLIFRELQELGPHPKETVSNHWAEHLTKNFAHRTILREVSQNRDFVLSLKPDLLYHLLQLWAAYDARDERQWLYSLEQLAKYDPTGNLRKAHAAWTDVCRHSRKASSSAISRDGSAT